MNAIVDAHAASHGTYGQRRIHAELVLGCRVKVSRGRVERLMRCTGLQGVHRRRLRGCTRRNPSAESAADLVERRFRAAAPDRLYVADITQHRTGKAGGTSPWCWTASPAASSAGRWPIICAQSWSSTPYRWRSGIGARPRGSSVFVKRPSAGS
jgi:transposase InsO family protein